MTDLHESHSDRIV